MLKLDKKEYNSYRTCYKTIVIVWCHCYLRLTLLSAYINTEMHMHETEYYHAM
jgi:hypothetical protein